MRGDEVQLLGIVVAPGRDDHSGGIQARNVEGAAQGASARPPAPAREVTQVGMRIDPQKGEAWVALDLRREGGYERAVVAAEHRQERRGRDLRQPVRNPRPSGLDVRSGVEVSDVDHAQPREQATGLRDRGYRGGQAAHPLRRQCRPFAIDRRPVVGDAGHDHVRGFRCAAHQAGPRLQAVQVHRANLGVVRTGRFSGTFKISNAPISSQAEKTAKMTGNPPGSPKIRGPALKGSSKKPPTNRAMIPDPAVAMLLKPMKSPASSTGITSWMKAQSTEKNKP